MKMVKILFTEKKISFIRDGMKHTETSIRARFANQIKDFMDEFKMSESGFSQEAVSNPKFAANIRRGGGASLGTMERAERYMSDYREEHHRKELEHAKAVLAEHGEGDAA